MNYGEYLYLLDVAQMVAAREAKAHEVGEEYHASRAYRTISGGGEALLRIEGDELHLHVRGADPMPAVRAVFGTTYTERNGVFVGKAPSSVLRPPT